MLEVKGKNDESTTNLLLTVAATWFVCWGVAFIAAGVNGNGHRHRFDRGGWIVLGAWLAPVAASLIATCLASEFNVRYIPRHERKMRRKVRRAQDIARVELASKQLEEAAGLGDH